MRKLIFATVLVVLSIPAYAVRDGWVTVDTLNRRTCQASKCGIVGTLMFREKATILEEKGGWARITKYYDAYCVNGISQYVDSGNNKCVSSNGITNGQFAEWVATKYLSSNRPADPAANASDKYALVKGSNDFRIYKDAFAKAADKLIESGRCSAGDFRESGGWYRSTKHTKTKPIYFMYCGRATISNRIYLNATTGKIFQ